MPEPTLSDAAALDRIAERYKAFGEESIFEDTSSTIELIGDLLERTGRGAWYPDGDR